MLCNPIAFGSALVFGIYYVLRGGFAMSRLRAALSEDFNSQADFQEGVPATAEASVTVGA